MLANNKIDYVKWDFNRNLTEAGSALLPANRQTSAYVHTKELQYQLKRKRGDYAHFDVEALDGALNSNMPFEDA